MSASAASVLLQGDTELVLASASPSRAALLSAAGLSFETRPAHLDEAAMRQALSANGQGPEPVDVAEILASAKAQTVSEARPSALVIGGDQVLALDGEILAKPANMDEARATLLKLRGKTHHLHAAVCVARGGEILWTHTDTAALTMRALSPKFIGIYLAAAGENVLSSVGAYQLESLGVHLFADIRGDYFTILGLPLLPLLDCLRREGAIVS